MGEPESAAVKEIGDRPRRSAGFQSFDRGQRGGSVLREQRRVGTRVDHRQHAALGKLPHDLRSGRSRGFQPGAILVAELHSRRRVKQQHGGDRTAPPLAEPVAAGAQGVPSQCRRHDGQQRGRDAAARDPSAALPLHLRGHRDRSGNTRQQSGDRHQQPRADRSRGHLGTRQHHSQQQERETTQRQQQPMAPLQTAFTGLLRFDQKLDRWKLHPPRLLAQQQMQDDRDRDRSGAEQ